MRLIGKLLLVPAIPTAVIVGLCSYNRTETEFTSLLCGCRRFDQWTESIVLEKGVNVEVEHRHSSDFYFSLGHAGGIGSGDDDYSVATFEVAGRHFRWAATRDERPIVLRPDRSRFWLVTFDRTDLQNCRFRFYSFGDNGKAAEVAAEKFPRRLAIQNMWLQREAGIMMDGKRINEFEIVEALDTSSHLFCESLTAKMWASLDAGVPYGAVRSIAPELLRRYKEKHLGFSEAQKKSP